MKKILILLKEQYWYKNVSAGVSGGTMAIICDYTMR